MGEYDEVGVDLILERVKREEKAIVGQKAKFSVNNLFNIQFTQLH